MFCMSEFSFLIQRQRRKKGRILFCHFFDPRLEEIGDAAFSTGWVSAHSVLPRCFLDTTTHQVLKGNMLEQLPDTELAELHYFQLNKMYRNYTLSVPRESVRSDKAFSLTKCKLWLFLRLTYHVFPSTSDIFLQDILFPISGSRIKVQCNADESFEHTKDLNLLTNISDLE